MRAARKSGAFFLHRASGFRHPRRNVRRSRLTRRAAGQWVLSLFLRHASATTLSESRLSIPGWSPESDRVHWVWMGPSGLIFCIDLKQVLLEKSSRSYDQGRSIIPALGGPDAEAHDTHYSLPAFPQQAENSASGQRRSGVDPDRRHRALLADRSRVGGSGVRALERRAKRSRGRPHRKRKGPDPGRRDCKRSDVGLGDLRPLVRDLHSRCERSRGSPRSHSDGSFRRPRARHRRTWNRRSSPNDGALRSPNGSLFAGSRSEPCPFRTHDDRAAGRRDPGHRRRRSRKRRALRLQDRPLRRARASPGSPAPLPCGRASPRRHDPGSRRHRLERQRARLRRDPRPRKPLVLADARCHACAPLGNDGERPPGRKGAAHRRRRRRHHGAVQPGRPVLLLEGAPSPRIGDAVRRPEVPGPRRCHRPEGLHPDVDAGSPPGPDGGGFERQWRAAARSSALQRLRRDRHHRQDRLPARGDRHHHRLRLAAGRDGRPERSPG